MGLAKDSPLRAIGGMCRQRRIIDDIALEYVKDDRNVFFTAKGLAKWTIDKGLIPISIHVDEEKIKRSLALAFSHALQRIEADGLIERRDITRKKGIKWKKTNQ